MSYIVVLSVLKISVILLSVIIPSAVMLNVGSPFKQS
jgi:hypothetical protein